jgi:hypothetical protein
MPKLISIEEVLEDFSYEATDEIKMLIASYLDLISEQLSLWIGTPFERASYVDHFWYDESSRANALPYTQFNLKAGFIVGGVTVEYAPTLEQFDPATALVKGGPVAVSQATCIVNAEQGTVRVHDAGLQTNAYYRISYLAGFESEPYRVNGISSSALYKGVPEWLRQSAKVMTSQLVRDHYAPNSRSKQVDHRLNDVLHLKSRRFGPSVRPL